MHELSAPGAALSDPGGALDFLPEMLERTGRAAREAGLGDVELLEAEMEDLPLPDASVDVVISNGLVNLSPRKARVLAECARVLQPGGELCVSDLTVDERDLPPRCWSPGRALVSGLTNSGAPRDRRLHAQARVGAGGSRAPPWQASPVSRPLSFDPIAEACRQWDRHWGTAATPAMGAVTSIMRVHQILLARLNEALAPYELTFPRYEALMLLYYSRRGELPLGKMGDRLQVHRTSVTNTIDGLERLGYVERSPHPRDRRTTMAAITERGREAAERATRALNEERFRTAPLGPAELDLLTETLRRMRVDAGDFDDGVGAAP